MKKSKITSENLSFVVSPFSIIQKSDKFIYDVTGDWIRCSRSSGDSVSVSRFHNDGDRYHVLLALIDLSQTYEELKSGVAKHGVSSEAVLIAIAGLIAAELVVITSSIEDELLEPVVGERYKWLLENFSYMERPGLSKVGMLKNLLVSKVCIVGVGGLGSIVAQLLVASGILDITLIDGDTVELSNLPRQLFYTSADVGLLKVDVMKRVLSAHQPSSRITAISKYIQDQQAAIQLTKSFDLIILCADEPRLFIHTWIGEASIENRVPYLAMGANWVGPISVPYLSPCYICQARYHRAKISDYDSFIRATLTTPVPPRAAFGPGPVLVGAMMSTMVVEFLAGINSTTHTLTRYQYNIWKNATSETLVRYTNCSRCKEIL